MGITREWGYRGITFTTTRFVRTLRLREHGTPRTNATEHNTSYKQRPRSRNVESGRRQATPHRKQRGEDETDKASAHTAKESKDERQTRDEQTKD